MVVYRHKLHLRDIEEIKDANVYWLSWLFGVLFTFGVLEHRAYNKGKPGLTLSGSLRRWIGIDPKRRGRRLLGMAFVGFFTWLAVHILDE